MQGAGGVVARLEGRLRGLPGSVTHMAGRLPAPPYRARPRLAGGFRPTPPPAPPSPRAGWRRRLWQLADPWRPSLHPSVVTAPLVLPAVVVSLLGYVLPQHLVTELYDEKVQSSVNIVDAGLATAGSEAAFTKPPDQPTTDNTTAAAMYALAYQLRSTGGTP